MKRATRERKPGKVERLEARVHPDQKRQIEHAAALQGRSVSEFVLQSAQEAAARTIAEHEILKLHGAEQNRFVAALRRHRDRLFLPMKTIEKLFQPT